MNVVVLCGGVGAARLLLGFNNLINSGIDVSVTAIVNTGDDDEIYGQFVCPDIDSILYHLAGVSDNVRGWGRQDESFHFVETLKSLGVDAWFNLGDRDLAMNNLRTNRLREGTDLREVTRELSSRLDVSGIDVIPMCNEKVTTTITTDDHRTLSMQKYFVREQCRPTITGISYDGAPSVAHPDAINALDNADLVIIAPSNPYLSIFPIFAIDEIDSHIRKNKEKVIAISPIVSGKAIKGPLAQNMRDHNIDVSAMGIAQIYADYISTLIIDSSDKHLVTMIEDAGIKVVAENTVMDSDAVRAQLAHHIIEIGESL